MWLWLWLRLRLRVCISHTHVLHIVCYISLMVVIPGSALDPV